MVPSSAASMGYGRFDGVETARVMGRLYAAARLYVNFFQPSFKLKEKRREGAKVIKRYHPPSTPYERALAHPKVTAAVKKRLRDQYRSLDPVALLAEIRATQDALGNRVDRRAGQTRGLQPAHINTVPATAATFAKTLRKTVTVGEPRATHRRTRRPYKTRVRMPSKLDPHIAVIEDWLVEQPQLTALAIVGRVREAHPEEFGARQHSIVQRLLRALRRSAAEQLAAQGPLGDATTAAPLPGLVDGSGYVGPDPPTAPLVEQAGKPSGAANQSTSDRHRQPRHQGNIRRCGKALLPPKYSIAPPKLWCASSDTRFSRVVSPVSTGATTQLCVPGGAARREGRPTRPLGRPPRANQAARILPPMRRSSNPRGGSRARPGTCRKAIGWSFGDVVTSAQSSNLVRAVSFEKQLRKLRKHRNR